MQIDHHSNIQYGCPYVVKDSSPMWTQDGNHKIASRGGQLGGTRPAREGSWRQSTLQGRAVRGDQASREGKLGANGLAGEQLDIIRAGMGVVRG